MALIVSGWGFARLTDRGLAVPDQVKENIDKPSDQYLRGKYYLTFSEAAFSLQMNGGGEKVQIGLPAAEDELRPVVRDSYFSEYHGEIKIDPSNPVIFLNVQWATTQKVHRFAKLVVEAEGKETFTHVFDAAGDIDDFVELPF